MCVICVRPFTWRKKWERSWEERTTCSKRCLGEERARRRSGGGASAGAGGGGASGAAPSLGEDGEESD
jgi:hypothetical protein